MCPDNSFPVVFSALLLCLQTAHPVVLGQPGYKDAIDCLAGGSVRGMWFASFGQRWSSAGVQKTSVRRVEMSKDSEAGVVQLFPQHWISAVSICHGASRIRSETHL